MKVDRPTVLSHTDLACMGIGINDLLVELDHTGDPKLPSHFIDDFAGPGVQGGCDTTMVVAFPPLLGQRLSLSSSLISGGQARTAVEGEFILKEEDIRSPNPQQIEPHTV